MIYLACQTEGRGLLLDGPLPPPRKTGLGDVSLHA
jgi:hypothetical protein